jgi:hypothetical protein
LSGHVFEGNFFAPPTGSNRSATNVVATFSCPSCGKAMTLTRGEGAMELLNRIREFIGEVSRDPQYGTDGSSILTEIELLEFTIRKLAEEAARP